VTCLMHYIYALSLRVHRLKKFFEQDSHLSVEGIYFLHNKFNWRLMCEVMDPKFIKSRGNSRIPEPIYYFSRRNFVHEIC
jgi:hypothetical protein